MNRTPEDRAAKSLPLNSAIGDGAIPPVSHPSSAISNCFPGLEFDFRAIWRRIFVGIVHVGNNNYVVEVEDH